MEPVYQAMVNHLRLKHLKKFMEAFDGNTDDEQSKFSTVHARIEYYMLEFDKDCAGDVTVRQVSLPELLYEIRTKNSVITFIGFYILNPVLYASVFLT